IETFADDCRENVNQIIEDLKTKVVIVKKKLSTIETIHACQIKTECEIYVKKGEETTSELHSIIDRNQHISNTTASDFQYNENQILDGKRTFFKRHFNETADRLLKFKNLLLETDDSTFIVEWKALQIEVQIIKEETDDPLLEPTGIGNFNQDLFIKSVIEEIDQQFQMRLKEQKETVSRLIQEMEVLTDELKGKQKQVDDLSKLKEQIKRVSSLTDEISVLQDKLEGKQEQIDDLSKLDRQLKEKQKKVTELVDENNKLKTEVHQKQQNEFSRLKEQDKRVSSLTDEISVLKDKLKGKQEQIDDLSKLDRQLKEKQKKVTELVDENNKLKTEVHQKQQNEFSRLKEQDKRVSSLTDEISVLKDKLKGKQEQIDDLSK
ncbi:Hypothetical predicted protein, partial [Mytilus galloprovincialis]